MLSPILNEGGLSTHPWGTHLVAERSTKPSRVVGRLGGLVNEVNPLSVKKKKTVFVLGLSDYYFFRLLELLNSVHHRHCACCYFRLNDESNVLLFIASI